MSTTVEKIKARLSIADVVSSYVKLEKAGGNFKGKCPFHNEKTPSFFVSPSRDTYHCFGCSKGGDIISFIEEIEGVEFIDALKLLGDRAGIPVTAEMPGKKKESDRLRALLAETTLFYQKELLKKKDAALYLKDRGLSKETIVSFKIGFAPSSWDETYNFLKKKGYSDVEMKKVGLIMDGKPGASSPYYDRFRGRIMFPIEDNQGKVIGFTGRVFNESDEKNAKYINSPQTELFDKSSILYGYSRAKESIRKGDSALIAEGQMDVIALAQGGYTNTVALSGTALTVKQLGLIKRLTDTVIFALDDDEAGYSALLRSATTALSLGLNPLTLSLRGHKDPAELMQDDSKLWEKIMEDKQHIVSYCLAKIRKETKDDREYKLNVSKIVLPLIARIDNKIDQAHFTKEAAESIHVPEDALREEIQKVIIEKVETEPKITQANKNELSRSRLQVIEDRLVGIILWQKSIKDPPINHADLLSELKSITKTNTNYETDIDEETKTKLVFEAELCYKNSDKLEKEVAELVRNLKEEIIREERMRAMIRMRDAEKGGNTDEAKNELAEYQKLSQELETLKSKDL